jgi:hypothetical protein
MISVAASVTKRFCNHIWGDEYTNATVYEYIAVAYQLGDVNKGDF